MCRIIAAKGVKQKKFTQSRVNWQRRLHVILILGVILVNIKKIFMDFSIDCEYAITMSYRLAIGDHMFSQMREPHQTSAFLLTIFIKIWMWGIGTTTGMVIYLNIVSVLIKFCVIVCFYRTLKKHCCRQTAFYMALFLAAINAKIYVLLDFSNLQIYSSILLLCCLICYAEEQKKKIWLILSALCMCLEVLSYPSCLLVYFVVITLLWNISRQRWKDCLLFSAVCGSMGIFYMGFFGFRLGWFKFFTDIHEILIGDDSHSKGLVAKFSGYWQDAGQLLLLYGIIALLSCIASLLVWAVRRNAENDRRYLVTFWTVFFFVLLGFFNLWSIVALEYTFQWVEFYLPLIVLGICLLPRCNEMERKIFWLGTGLSVGGMFAVLLLTNLTLNCALAYLVLGVAVAFIPIGRRLQSLFGDTLIPFTILMALILFRGFFLFLSMTLDIQRIFSLGNIVKAGPAIGIISDYMGPYTMNCDIQEWSSHIHPGDSVLIVSGNELMGSLKYLYEDITISIDSTICTPTYNEKLLRYWEQNPNRYPDVVVVKCWFGDLKVAEDSWIMQWINEEFGADSYVDGTYQRYYRRSVE